VAEIAKKEKLDELEQLREEFDIVTMENEEHKVLIQEMQMENNKVAKELDELKEQKEQDAANFEVRTALGPQPRAHCALTPARARSAGSDQGA
jgi:hypothetical protein